MSQRKITLEQKLKAMREVQRIYDLSKKWQRGPGHGGKMPNFTAMADAVMKRAMDAEVVGDKLPLDIRDGKVMHQQGSREARILERTLRNGIVHPDVLHSFQSGRTRQPADQSHTANRDLGHDPDLPEVDLFLQHSDVDMHYPSHFVPGEGFVPKSHEQPRHTQLAAAGSGAATEQVPTQQGVVRPQAGAGYV